MCVYVHIFVVDSLYKIFRTFVYVKDIVPGSRDPVEYVFIILAAATKMQMKAIMINKSNGTQQTITTSTTRKRRTTTDLNSNNKQQKKHIENTTEKKQGKLFRTRCSVMIYV